MDPFAQKTLNLLLEVSSRVDLNIKHFLLGYAFDNPKLPISYDAILLSVKTAVYDIIILLIFSTLKIVIRNNSLVTLLFVLSLTIFAGATFLVFLGFFQILFS